MVPRLGGSNGSAANNVVDIELCRPDSASFLGAICKQDWVAMLPAVADFVLSQPLTCSVSIYDLSLSSMLMC